MADHIAEALTLRANSERHIAELRSLREVGVDVRVDGLPVREIVLGFFEAGLDVRVEGPPIREMFLGFCEAGLDVRVEGPPIREMFLGFCEAGLDVRVEGPPIREVVLDFCEVGLDVPRPAWLVCGAPRTDRTAFTACEEAVALRGSRERRTRTGGLTPCGLGTTPLRGQAHNPVF
jgi:hypothetical protein